MLSSERVAREVREAYMQLERLRTRAAHFGAAWGGIERTIGMLKELEWTLEIEAMQAEGIIVSVHTIELVEEVTGEAF